MNPTPRLPADADSQGRSQAVVDKWKEHNATRLKLLRDNVSSDKVDEMGYRYMSFNEFKKLQESPEERERLRQQQERQFAVLATAGNIKKFNEQGRVLKGDDLLKGMDFRTMGRPSIYNAPIDINSVMLMFSEPWEMMMGHGGLTDSELMLMVDSTNAAAVREHQRQMNKSSEIESEEEIEKRREQQILDYSAKVNNGYIEVKIGEDEVAMRDAFSIHNRKRREAMDRGVPYDKLPEMGLAKFTWEEWKRYYRKMHGVPEDGIKRIPFEGQKKEREIDWGKRVVLSVDEFKKYGIEVSQDGPVMIPLDKAMKVAGDLFANAKKIHSIRDGLEIIRTGLVNETHRLRERRERGYPVASVGIPAVDESQTIGSVPDTS